MLDKQLLSKCRDVDLYDFLLRFAPGEWKKEGNKYLRHKEHTSCIVTKGKGFIWNSRNVHGHNPIDFLIVFYCLNFRQAIQTIKSHISFYNNSSCFKSSSFAPDDISSYILNKCFNL